MVFMLTDVFHRAVLPVCGAGVMPAECFLSAGEYEPGGEEKHGDGQKEAGDDGKFHVVESGGSCGARVCRGHAGALS